MRPLLLATLLCGCSLTLNFDDDCSQDSDCPATFACNGDGLCIRDDGTGMGGQGGQVEMDMDVDMARGGADGQLPDAAVDMERSDATRDGGVDRGPDVGPDAGSELVLDEQCHTVHGVPIEDIHAEDTLLFGSVLPRSGQLGEFGPPMSQAIYLAVDEINQQGGLGGKRFAVVTCDSGTDPVVANANAARLAAAGVPAIIGPAASGITLAVFNDVAREAGMLVITPSGTSPSISDLQDDDLLWRTVPSDAIQGAAIGAHLLAESYERIAVINRDDTYGQGLKGAIQTALCEAGACDEARYFTRSYPENGDLQAQAALLNPLSDFDPEVLVLIAFLDDGISFMNFAGATGITNFVLTDGTKDTTVIEQVMSEPLVRGLIGTAPASPAGANFQNFTLAYTGKWGTDPGVFTAQAYDAMYLLAYAAAGANGETLNGATLAANLRRLSEGERIDTGPANWNRASTHIAEEGATFDYVGASGELNFDQRGEAPGDIEAWRFDVDEVRVRTLGILFTADGTYRGIQEPDPPPDAGVDAAPDAGE